MNLRQLKQRTLARLCLNNYIGWYPPEFAKVPPWVEKVRAREAAASETPLGDLPAKTLEEPAVKYVCKKVKDDSVVGEFSTREEAMELMQKHTRQKKAKLYIEYADQHGNILGEIGTF